MSYRSVGARSYHFSVSTYLSFCAFAALIAVAPGPDTFLTLRNTMTRGRQVGLWTMLGICVAGALQGVLAAAGLGAIIAHAEPVFLAIRIAGVAYLIWLGIGALRSAWKAKGADWSMGSATTALPRGHAWRATRQGFLCNITNPKVLAFNLAVLPQFVGKDGGFAALMAYALTLTVIGAIVLLAVVVGASRARRALQRKSVQRGIEAGTGVAMLGFATALATEA